MVAIQLVSSPLVEVQFCWPTVSHCGLFSLTSGQEDKLENGLPPDIVSQFAPARVSPALLYVYLPFTAVWGVSSTYCIVVVSIFNSVFNKSGLIVNKISQAPRATRRPRTALVMRFFPSSLPETSSVVMY